VTTRSYLIVTSIAAPNAVLTSLAEGANRNGVSFIVVGDTKSPDDFALPGCRFYSIQSQRELGFAFADVCPTRHYARKNIGYLTALREGAEIIVETDDDNFPYADFWSPRSRLVGARLQDAPGWYNAYRAFTDANIWPRGLPLDEIHAINSSLSSNVTIDSPIQQALANSNPDVDAVYRLALPLPLDFEAADPVGLAKGVWCPFNSQNTTWWRDAAPLMYLPAYCSFRMTDIWRSFVAQRIAWENGWFVTFHQATVWQERNAHDLMKDFSDEIPGYLHNKSIAAALAGLELTAGLVNLADNLRRCYIALVNLGMVGEQELPLVDAWISDLQSMG
jgi:hypothetical protein